MLTTNIRNLSKGVLGNKPYGQTCAARRRREAFGDKLVYHLKKHQDVPEIPQSQRYANWPGLDRIFSARVLEDRRKRNRTLMS